MSADLVAMHRAFLDQIAERREQIRIELGQLDTVEEYHRRALDSLSHNRNGQFTGPTKSRALRVAMGLAAKPPSVDPQLADKNRHDACLFAMQSLGGKAKTQQVANWLRERGYGMEFDSERVFHNTCYTAMSRKKELFQKIGPGEWKLVSS